MSKIEVNTVEPQCGTTLTLGACGQTVALGSGASQTGFGRTGTVDWITTPKVTGDSPVTGVTGKGYFLNTTAGTITINLPAGAAGSIISMADYAGTWQTNNVTVTPNGSDKIGGTNTNAVLNTEGQSVTFVYVDATQGWINTMDSTSNVRASEFISATGGTPCAGATCGDYKVHTFTGPGTFCVSRIGACATNNLVSYMVIAGGGGGGGYYSAGGGGAGGYREVVSPTSPYTGSPTQGYPTPANRITVAATSYPIVVGGGGPAGPGVPGSNCGTQGSTSTFSTISSAGGGYGAAQGSPTPVPGGGDGGSGGGGTSWCAPSAGGTGNTPPTTPAQGTDGGAARSIGGDRGGGGGGGATAVGQAGQPPATGGDGGDGATSSINGTPTARAGGGGGGSGSPGGNCGGGAGGAGGGGTGQANDNVPAATAGDVNTGSGGGGGGGVSPGACGGAGGSGIVIIRYKFQ